MVHDIARKHGFDSSEAEGLGWSTTKIAIVHF